MARRYGFVALDLDTKEELRQLNSKLDPLMMRYQGMGWYDILVQHEKGYAILSMGGENGWTAEDNEKKYIAIGDEYEFKNLDNLLESIDKRPWQEIISQEEFTGGVHQKVREVYPDDEVDDFIDPLKEY